MREIEEMNSENTISIDSHTDKQRIALIIIISILMASVIIFLSAYIISTRDATSTSNTFPSVLSAMPTTNVVLPDTGGGKGNIAFTSTIDV